VGFLGHTAGAARCFVAHYNCRGLVVEAYSGEGLMVVMLDRGGVVGHGG
jgi:hypothetical protein